MKTPPIFTSQLRAGYVFILLAICIGLITRIIFVFQYVTFDIGPDPDQIRDAFTVMNIWQGHFPTLGPRASVGGHSILPLYYYLFFPFTILGANPEFQALPNAFFSFLSIPLLMYLIYSLLENERFSLRIFLSGLGGLWYSLLFGDIFISNFQWNPSSIPFFLMTFSLLYKLQLDRKYSFSIQILFSVLYGINFAILMSLHSSTLFILPVAFFILSSIYIYIALKRRRGIPFSLLPFISLASTLIVLLPYWIGEIERNFQNTKAIAQTILTSSNQSNPNFLIYLYGKIINLILNYVTLAQQAYFWNTSWIFLVVSVVFSLSILFWGVRAIKINQPIWLAWCSIWIVFLIASSNIDALNIPFFYKISVIFLPIILTLFSLIHINKVNSSNWLLISLFGAFIALSTICNLQYDYRFMGSKYGNHRLMNTTDMTQILSKLTSGSTLCDPRIGRKRRINNIYNYIDSYVTHNKIIVSEECHEGDLVIHPKRIMLITGNYINSSNYQEPYFVKNFSGQFPDLFPTFKVVENDDITRSVELVSETDVAYVYRLND
jgi:hypothetical protein